MAINEMHISNIISLNESKGRHFFSTASMRFFNSRLSNTAYKLSNKAYFVTSEQGPNKIRAYSIRECNLETGDIHTIGEFQAYKTGRDALTEIKKMLIKEVKQ